MKAASGAFKVDHLQPVDLFCRDIVPNLGFHTAETISLLP